MATIKPFICVRPTVEMASKVAALPYDVYNREEAKEAVGRNPMSFLAIDRAETQLEDTMDPYAPEVYQKAKELLEDRKKDGTYLTDSESSYYLYELIMDGRSQTGIVACASIDDYEQGVIKKHEKTREEKEIDRINHVDTCNAQTGPIFLAYRKNQTISEIVEAVKKENPLYDFVSEDGITHRVWKVQHKTQNKIIENEFANIQSIYIADGHHRAASAVKVGQKRRLEAGEYDGSEPFNYFLSVLFPDEELKILPYNRVVMDLNGLSKIQFLEALKKDFEVDKIGDLAYAPEKKGCFGMYLDDEWYKVVAKEPLRLIKDPVKGLDVAILQDYLLHPILGIGDPRTDERIDFVGGIRGLSELEKRVHMDCKVAFSMYPTSITELFEVADADQLMPPKSTWFEPKLRSGLFIHEL